MSYPCFTYSISNTRSFNADNITYRSVRSYDVIHITKDPDTDIINKMLDNFENCSHSRRYVVDNLIHDAFTLFY